MPFAVRKRSIASSNGREIGRHPDVERDHADRGAVAIHLPRVEAREQRRQVPELHRHAGLGRAHDLPRDRRVALVEEPELRALAAAASQQRGAERPETEVLQVIARAVRQGADGGAHITVADAREHPSGLHAGRACRSLRVHAGDDEPPANGADVEAERAHFAGRERRTAHVRRHRRPAAARSAIGPRARASAGSRRALHPPIERPRRAGAAPP